MRMFQAKLSGMLFPCRLHACAKSMLIVLGVVHGRSNCPTKARELSVRRSRTPSASRTCARADILVRWWSGTPITASSTERSSTVTPTGRAQYLGVASRCSGAELHRPSVVVDFREGQVIHDGRPRLGRPEGRPTIGVRGARGADRVKVVAVRILAKRAVIEDDDAATWRRITRLDNLLAVAGVVAGVTRAGRTSAARRCASAEAKVARLWNIGAQRSARSASRSSDLTAARSSISRSKSSPAPVLSLAAKPRRVAAQVGHQDVEIAHRTEGVQQPVKLVA
jgi:hypothetical protein